MKLFVAIILILAMALPVLGEDTADVRYGFHSFHEGLFVVEATYINEMGIYETREGIVDMDGHFIVEPVWEECGQLHDGLALVWMDDKPFGYVNETGEVVIYLDSEHVSDAMDFSDGMAAVKYDGLWGYIDASGSFAIEPFTDGVEWVDYFDEFDCIYPFSEGCAVVKGEDGYGYMDRTGSIVIPCIYEYAEAFSGGAACVLTGDGYGVIDKTGAWICEPDICAGLIVDGYFVIRQNELEGVMDTKGTICVDVAWDEVYNLGNGIMRVVNDGMNGYLDVNGDSDVALTAYEAGDTSSAFDEEPDYALGNIYFRICADDKYGVIDMHGNIVVEPEYDYVGEYSDGLFPVCLDGKYGYVDTQGNVAIELIYDKAYRFGGGIAAVEKKYSLGFIDTTGNAVTEFDWYPERSGNMMGNGSGAYYYEYGGRGVWVVQKYGTNQLIDTEGNVISIGE